MFPPQHDCFLAGEKESTVHAVFDSCRRVCLFINRMHPLQNNNNKKRISYKQLKAMAGKR